MKRKTTYVVVKVVVETPDQLPEDVTQEDVVEEVVSVMDYSMFYDQAGVKIVDTEVMGQTDKCPV